MRRGKARSDRALPWQSHFYLDMERISILIFMFQNVCRISATAIDCVIRQLHLRP